MKARFSWSYQPFVTYAFFLLACLVAACASRETSPISSHNDAYVLTAPKPLGENQLASLAEGLSQIKGSGPWQQYTRLMLSFANGKGLRFQSQGSEMLVDFIDNSQTRAQAFIIPKVVLMTRNLPSADAPPSHVVEYAGLHGQLALFILQQAFPAGPTQVKPSNHAVVVENAKEHEIRFLAGVLKLRPSWQAEVDATRAENGRIDFEIVIGNPDKRNEKTPLSGSWENKAITSMPLDAERLTGWDVSFHGARSLSTGKISPTIGDTSRFATIGDIRRAGRSAQ